jgi:putative membrane protein
MGWRGALLYWLYSLTIFLWLGGAWLAAAPGEPIRKIGLFCWARIVREAVADLLPFSQIGGLVVGARVLLGRGMIAPRVYASMIVDLTTEMASQFLFTLFGLATMASLLLGKTGAALRPVVFGSLAGLVMIVALLVLGQRPVLALATRLAQRILPGAVVKLDAVERELSRIYAHRPHIALSFLFNLAGWVGSAAGASILLHLVGVPIPFLWVLAIEGLIFTVRSVAFAVPGAIGFQEAAYVLIGPLFGLSPELALGLSIAKRARDIAIGIPALLIWQSAELRALIVKER